MFHNWLRVTGIVLSLGWSHVAHGAASFEIALTLDTPSTGVSTTPDGRLFVLLARPQDGSSGPQVVEWKNNATVAYPGEEWNSYSAGKDPAKHLVRVNAQRIGPDGSLWIVDTGSPGFGEPVLLPDGAKLVKVDVKTNSVSRVYSLGNVSQSATFIDDIRFSKDGSKAYLTDAGTPGLIVLDVCSGMAQRVLDNHISTRAYTPVSAAGHLLYGQDGKASYLHADQLEVSPDGEWLYYQPCSGGMSRIQTKLLDHAFYNSSLRYELGDYVEPFALTASTGGTAIDAKGNIYISDTDRFSIYKIAPNGTSTRLLEDSRLAWIDAMWIDSNATLWMPAAQLFRGIPFNNGTSRIQTPTHVYKMQVDQGPPAIDHS